MLDCFDHGGAASIAHHSRSCWKISSHFTLDDYSHIFHKHKV